MAISQATTEEAATAVGDFFGLPPLAAADLGQRAIAVAIAAAIVLIARFPAHRLCRWLERAVLPKLDVDENKVPIASNHLARAIAAVAAIALLNMAAAAYDCHPIRTCCST